MKKLVLLLTLACVSILPSRAANNSFLKIPSIPGESTDAKHPGEIVVVDFQHNIDHSSASVPTATLSVTKLVDRASPALAKATATGVALPQITLTVRKPGDTPIDFYIVTLDNATAVSVDQFSKEGSLIETVTFSASKITWTYVPQKPDGKPGEPIVETAPISRHSP